MFPFIVMRLRGGMSDGEDGGRVAGAAPVGRDAAPYHGARVNGRLVGVGVGGVVDLFA